MRMFSILAALCLVQILTSCESSDTDKRVLFSFENPAGGIPQAIKSTSAAFSREFVIRSNAAWRIDKPQTADWLSVAPTQGRGDGRITISAEANAESEFLRCELTFFAGDKQVFSLPVEQEPAGLFLVVTPETVSIPAAGGEVRLEVQTNAGAWEYQIKGDDSGWLREKSKDATGVTFAADRNALTTELTAIAEFSASQSPELVQRILFRQSGQTNTGPDVLLDVLFASDGTALDASPMEHVVQTVAGSAMMTYYNDSYGCYVARFNHTPGSGIGSGYYKMNYADNKTFRDALADGHSLEVLFMYDVDTKAASEVKMFSSMQSGGTGFLLADNTGEISFLPNLGSWQWTRSGVIPQRGRYYHVVGVWDQAKNKSSIYINGELKTSVNALGIFNFPTPASCNWFCIGADAGPSGAESAWRGDIVLARIYNDPLTDDKVGELWTKVGDKEPQQSIQISDVLFFSDFAVASGSKYRIAGKGFLTGDMLRLESVAGGAAFSCRTTVSDTFLDAEIPDEFTSGRYRMVLQRGDATCPLGLVTLTLSATSSGLVFPEVVAHRGFHTTNDAPQNSLASLAAAQQLGIYGSETDFYITRDGVVVCHHDPEINGVMIENVDYAQVENYTLANGEKLPTLEMILAQLKKNENMKLVLEIKSHTTNANNGRAVDAIVEMVARQGLAAQVDYIAFSDYICLQLGSKAPSEAVIGYLSGNLAPDLLPQGVNCIDYQMTVLRNNPQWIGEAHERGMTVNVWTVNSQQDMMDFIAMGVDFITTDHPDVLKQIIDCFSE